MQYFDISGDRGSDGKRRQNDSVEKNHCAA
jgi:hypothetical protein